MKYWDNIPKIDICNKMYPICNARVSALVVVLSDSPCETTGKWKTCPVFEEDRLLERVWLEHL
jgi:hypothetical protein